MDEISVLVFTVIMLMVFKSIYSESSETWSCPYHLQAADISKSLKHYSLRFNRAIAYVLKMEKRYPSFHIHLGLGCTYDDMAIEVLTRMSSKPARQRLIEV